MSFRNYKCAKIDETAIQYSLFKQEKKQWGKYIAKIPQL
jgi:hypothetical protein